MLYREPVQITQNITDVVTRCKLYIDLQVLVVVRVPQVFVVNIGVAS